MKPPSSISRQDFIKLFAVASVSLFGAPILARKPQSASPKSAPPPNILVLVFDALSAANMSLYGYPRNTTPNLERFAENATIYHRHYAAGNFTTPGAASLLTGVYPWTHRAINLQGHTSQVYQQSNLFSLLPTEYHRFAYTHNSLAYLLLDDFQKAIDDLLKISDLAVYSDLWVDKLPFSEFSVPFEAELVALKNSFSTNSSLFLSLLDTVQRTIQSDRYYQVYRDQFPRGLTNCRSGDRNNALCFSLEMAIDWIQEQFLTRPQPFLGYVHLFPPHAPYNPRKEFIGQFSDPLPLPSKPDHFFSDHKDKKSLARLRERYDETIAYVDSEFGRLLDFLKESNSLVNTCLVVTSDHGELLERGISGHNTPVLYEPLTHIPLLIAYPDQNSRQDIYQPTSAIDLTPTLLQFAGAENSPLLEGSLLPREDKSGFDQRSIFTLEAKSNPKNGPLKRATFALIQDRYKMIYYQGYENFDQVFEVYDLENDPQETVNLYSPDDMISKDLEEALRHQINAIH